MLAHGAPCQQQLKHWLWCLCSMLVQHQHLSEGILPYNWPYPIELCRCLCLTHENSPLMLNHLLELLIAGEDSSKKPFENPLKVLGALGLT